MKKTLLIFLATIGVSLSACGEGARQMSGDGVGNMQSVSINSLFNGMQGETVKEKKKREKRLKAGIIKTKLWHSAYSGKAIPSCYVHFPKSLLSNSHFFRKPVSLSDFDYAKWSSSEENGAYKCGPQGGDEAEGKGSFDIVLKSNYGRRLGLKEPTVKITLRGVVRNMKFHGKVEYLIQTQDANTLFYSMDRHDGDRVIATGFPERDPIGNSHPRNGGVIYAVNGVFAGSRGEYAKAKSLKSPILERFNMKVKLMSEMDGGVRHIKGGMALETVAAITNAYIDYNVRPKSGQLKHLKAKRYRVVIGIDMRHVFRVGNALVTTTREEETKDELVLLLKKNDRYRLAGRKKLKSVIARNSGRVGLFGVNKQLIKSEPAVYVKKVTAE